MSAKMSLPRAFVVRHGLWVVVPVVVAVATLLLGSSAGVSAAPSNGTPADALGVAHAPGSALPDAVDPPDDASLLALAGGPDAFGYTFRDSDEDPSIGDFYDISGTGAALSALTDDDRVARALPFPFHFYGVDRNGASLQISSNGFVSFAAAGATRPDNVAVPNAAIPNDAIYPFWDDLDPTNALGHVDVDSTVYWQVLGAAPNRRMIVQWNEVPFSPVTGGVLEEGVVTFQVQLWEDGRILFAYGDPARCDATDCDRGSGGSATIGIESATTLAPAQTGLQYSFNSPSLQLKTDGFVDAILFDPPQLSIAKECFAASSTPPSGPEVVLAGAQWVCRITVRNDGPADVPNVFVGDTFGAYVTLVASTAVGPVTPALPVAGPASVSVGVGMVPAEGEVAFELAFVVDTDYVAGTPNGEREVCNEAAITSPVLGDASDVARDCDLVTGTADLRLTKMVKPDNNVPAGGTVYYTVYVDNLGPSAAVGAVVNDTMTANGPYTVTSITSPDGAMSCTPPAPPAIASSGANNAVTFSCALAAPLAPGDRWTIVATATADNAVSLNNMASVTATTPDPATTNNTATGAIRVDDAADLSVLKTAVGTVHSSSDCDSNSPVANSVTAGANLVYTLVTTNNGPSSADNVRILDAVPAGVTVVSITGSGPNGSATCQAGTPGDPAAPASCAFGALANGQQATMTLTVRVDPGYVVQHDPPYLSNDAWTASDAIDPNNQNDLGANLTVVGAVADLEVWKADQPNTVVAGNALTYEIIVNNRGPSVSEAVTVSDVLPTGVAFESASVVEGGTCTYDAGANVLLCHLGDVPPGGPPLEQRHVVVNVRVRPDVAPGTNLLNQASADSFQTPDCGLANNLVAAGCPLDTVSGPGAPHCQVETAVLSDSSVRVRKSASTGTPVPGGEVVYTLDVTSTGPSLARDVLLEDTLPAAVTVTYVDGPSCSVGGGQVQCALGDMAPGETARVEVHVRVDAGAGCNAPVDNSALVRWDEDDNGATGPSGREATSASSTANLTTRCVADLSVRKFGKPDGSVQAGQSLTYYVVTTNNGPSQMPAGSVTVDDLLASSGQFQVTAVGSDLAGTCSFDGGAAVGLPYGGPAVPSSGNDLAVRCTATAPLAPGASWLLTLTVTATEAQTLNNTATISAPLANDPTSGNNQAAVEHDITASADLAIDKSQSPPGTIVAGNNVTYVLSVTNNGVSTAEGVVVVDTLPMGLALVSATPSVGACGTAAAPGGGTLVTCNLGNMSYPPASVATVTIVATVGAGVPAGTVLRDSATVSSANFDPGAGDNVASLGTNVGATSEIYLAKSEPVGQADPVTAGQLVDYQIVVRNNGPSVARNVRVVDALTDIAFLEYLGVDVTGAPNAQCALVGAQIRCDLDDLPVGENQAIIVHFRVKPDAPAGTVLDDSVYAVADSPTTADPASDLTETTTVVADSAVRTQKTARDGTPTAGGTLTYRVDVANDGPSTAFNVRVTDVLDGNLAYLYSTSATCSAAGQTVTCDLGDIAPGATVTFDIVVEVDEDATGVIGNTATTTWETLDASPPGTGSGGTSADPENVDVAQVADLSLRKFGKPDGRVEAGQTLTYYLSVTNAGPSDAPAGSVTIDDLLASSGAFDVTAIRSSRVPAGCSFDGGAANALPWSGTQASSGTNLDVACTLAGALPTGGEWLVEIDVTAAQAQTLNNVAQVSAAGVLDPDTSDNYATVEHDIEASADLSIAKTGAATVVAGNQFTYNLTINNGGVSAADGVVVVDMLPLGVRVVTVVPSTGSCATVQGVAGNLEVTCALGDLPAGGGATVAILVEVDPSVLDGTRLFNRATVGSENFDPSTGNNLSSAYTDVTATSELFVDKDGAPNPATAGQTVTYQVVVRNDGPSVARNVRFRDSLTGGAQFVTLESYGTAGGPEAVCFQEDFSPSVRCDLGDMAPASVRGVFLTFRVAPDAPAGLVLGDTVSMFADSPITTDPDSDPTETIDVQAEAAVRVRKVASGGSPVAGGDVTYSVEVTNDGPSTAADVRLIDNLPSSGGLPLVGVLYISDNTCNVSGAGTRITCDIGDLAAGATYTVDIHVRLDADLACGSTLANAAVARWDGDLDPESGPGGREEVTATSTAEVTVDCVSDLMIQKFGKPDGTVAAGEDLTYYIVTTNNGPSTAPANTVFVEDLLASSGAFTLQSIASDHTASCSVTPPVAGNLALPFQCQLLVPLAPSEQWILTVTVTATEAQTLNNRARVRSTTALDPDPSNDTALVEHDIAASADLRVIKTDSADPATAGAVFAYDLTVTNGGVSTAEGVTVEDTLPLGLTVVGITQPGPGRCATTQGAGGNLVVRCQLGDFEPGDSTVVRITVAVDPAMPGGSILWNQARVGSDNYDPNNANNLATERTRIDASSNLLVTKVDAADPVTAGGVLEYVLAVVNGGPSVARDVIFADDVPDGLTLIHYNAGPGPVACEQSLGTGDVVCHLGDLAAGEPRAILLRFAVDPDVPDGAVLTNNVAWLALSDATFEGDTSEQTTVTNASALAVTKVASDPTPVAGAELSYTVTVANHGASTAFDVVVADNLGLAGVEYLYATDAACVFGEGVLNCGLGDMAPGETRAFQVFVRVPATFGCGATLANTALVTWDDGAEQTPLATASVTTATPVECVADLRMTKYGKPDGELQADESIQYTLIVDNLGPSAIRNASFKDVLSSDGTFTVSGFTSDRTSVGCVPDPVGTWSDQFLFDCRLAETLDVLRASPEAVNPGRWIVRYTVTADEAQDINNTADAAFAILPEAPTPFTDPNPANNQAHVQHAVSAVADLSVTKRDSADPVVAGTQFDYVLRVDNGGPSTAENVVVEDTLPLELEVVSITNPAGGSCAVVQSVTGNRLVTCTLGNLPDGASRTITIRVRVDAGVPDGARLFNQALVYSDNFDNDNSDDIAREPTDIEAAPNLRAVKVSDRDDVEVEGDEAQGPALAGTTLEYTVRVLNTGVSDAPQTVVVDTLPAGTTFVGAAVTIGTGSCLGAPAGQVTCQLGTLPPGATYEIVIRVAVDAARSCATPLVNRVTATTPAEPEETLSDNTASITTSVACEADLAIEKVGVPTKVFAGEQVRYTIRVTNNGPAVARAVALTDVLPADTTYEINTHGCAAAGNTVNCAVGDLAPGATWSVDIAALVQADTAGGTVLGNLASTSSSTADPNTADNAVLAENLVLEKADLRVEKFGKPDGQVAAGDVLEYTVIVDNLGPSWATGVSIKDVLQSDGPFDIVSVASDRPANCSAMPGDTFSPTGGDQADVDRRYQLDCTLDAPLEVLEANGPPNSGRWILTIQVTADEQQDLNNAVTTLFRGHDPEGPALPGYDPDTANNYDFVEHDFTAVADLSVTKDDSTDPVTAGDEMDYTIVVTNNGESTAKNVVVVDTLPLGLTVVADGIAVTPGPGTCTTVQLPAGNQQIQCNLGDFEVEEVQTITVTVLVDQALADGRVLYNRVEVSSESYDPDNANNVATEDTTVESEPGLSVWKDVDRSPAMAGESLEYTIVVENTGLSDATNVEVFDDLPDAVTVQAAQVVIGAGTCTTMPTGSVVCQIPRLVAGERVVISVRVMVDPDPALCGTELWNYVYVSSDEDPEGGYFDLATLVECNADLTVTKTVAPQKQDAGEQVKYTVTVVNTGPTDATDVVVVDTLPADVDYEVDTDACVEGPAGTLTCALGDIAAGGSKAFDVWVRIAPETGAGTTITNRACASSAVDDLGEGNNCATADVLVEKEADLRVVKYGKPDGEVRANETLHYTIIVDNLGPSWADGVALKDVLSSSGEFEVVGWTTDRPATCAPDDPPSGIHTQEYRFDCTLAGPLEVLAASGDAVNPGRWMVTLDVVARQNQDINNTATVTSPADDPDQTNNVAHTEHEITSVADLAVDKSGPATIVAGTQVTWQIVVTNNGPSVAENTVVYDRLPAGIVVRSATVTGGSGTCTTGQAGEVLDKLSCGLGNLASGAERTVTIVADVDPRLADGSVLENDALVLSEVFDNFNPNNFDHTLTEVVTSADLSVGKSCNPGPIAAGTVTTYDLTFANAGPSTAHDVILTDVLPRYFRALEAFVVDGDPAFDSATCFIRSGDPALVDSVTCELGDIPAGKTGRAVIKALVRPDAPANAYTNQVTIASDTPDPGPGVDSATCNTTVVQSADLQVVKTVAPDKQDAGKQVKYTVTVSNLGPSDAPNVVVADVLPAAVRYEVDTDNCTVTGTDPFTGGQMLTCPVGSLGVGDSASFDVWALIDPSTDPGITIVNMACAASDIADPNEPNNCDTADVYVENEADLKVTKYGKPDGSVRAQELLTYTVIVDNYGPSWARGVSLKDVLESSGEYEVLSLSADRGMSCTYLPAGAPPKVVSGRLQVDCTLTDPLALLDAAGFPNPGRWILTMVVQALEDQDIDNTADVLSAADDPDMANNHAETMHEITAVADLRIEKTGPAETVAGTQVQWSITVTNLGPSEAENTVVYDRLPPGVTLTGVDAEGGTCTTGEPGNVLDKLTCALGTLAADEDRTITIDAFVEAGLRDGAILENDVSVTSDMFDDDNSNNFDHTLTEVGAEAALTVEKIAVPPVATAGEPLEYLITVSNGGPSDAADVVVVDHLPAGVSFVSATVVVGTGVCQGAPTGQVTCQLGSLPEGGEVLIRIVVSVDPGYDCTIDLVNDVTVTSPSSEEGATTLLVTDVACEADLEIRKTSTPVKVFAGEQKKYTVTVTNHGPSDAYDVLITDLLPDEVTYEINTGGCAAIGNTVTCQLEALPVGGTFTFDIYALVLPGAMSDSIITNTATVTSPTPDPDEENNRATSDNYVQQKADLKITKFGKPDETLRAGEVLTYTVIVDNLGPSWADGVAIKDILQSDKHFRLIGIESDRAFACASVPQGAPGGVADVDQRLVTDCFLDERLAVLAAPRDGGENGQGLPRNPGRWILTMSVTAPETSDLNNVVEVTSDAFIDPLTANNFARVEHAITDVADLAVEKTGPAAVVAGTSMQYQLRVTNGGPSTAENVVLRDRLPAGVRVTGASASQGGCTTGTAGDAADMLACGLGSLRQGASATVAIDVFVDPAVSEGSILENDALVTSDIFDPTNANNFAHALTTVETVADLEVRKVAVGPFPWIAGEVRTYEYDIVNTGPSWSRDVKLVDMLPPEVEFLGAYMVVENRAGGVALPCYAATDNTLVCPLGDIPLTGDFVDGRSPIAVFIDVLIKSTTADGTVIANAATLFSDTEDPDGSGAEVEVEVRGNADLMVEKWSSPVMVYAGEQKKYTVKVTNLGPTDAVNVLLTDSLPPEVTYEIDTALCADAGNTVTCDFGTLKPGESRLVDIYALVRPETPPGTVILNTATVTSDTPDALEANNVAASENLILQKADLRIVKFGKEDGVVNAGDVLTYTVILDNLGPSYANNVAIKDVLQAAGTFDLIDIRSDRAAVCVGLPGPNPAVNLAATGWPVVDPPAAFGVIAASGGVANILQRLEVDCRLTSPLEVLVASGPPNPGRWILTMRVRSRDAQDMDNVAAATSSAYEPDPSNNLAQVEHQIIGLADLQVTKSSVGEVVTGCSANNAVISNVANQVTAGLNIVYTITVRNNGASQAENTVVYDLLPPGVTVLGGTVDGSAAAFSAQCHVGAAGDATDQLTCGLGTINAVGKNTVTITVTVRTSAWLASGSVLENDVYVTSTVFDGNNMNNFAHNLTTVGTSADLRVAKTHDPATAIAGQLLRYTLAITNDGPSVARDVWAYDQLPSGVIYQNAVLGTCTEDPVLPGALACQMGDIEPGRTEYLYITVLVEPDAPATLTNTAYVQSGFSDDTPNPSGVITPDPCPGDNAATDITSDIANVIRTADVFVTKLDLTDPAIAGREAIYQVTFGNNGPSTATNVTVVDTLPTGFTFKRCDPIHPDDEVTCTAAGRVVTLESIKRQNTVVFASGGTLGPNTTFSYLIVAEVDPGYLQDALGDAGAGEMCRAYGDASGYPYWAHNNVRIGATQDGAVAGNNFDDECTRVNALADLAITKVDDAAGFLTCDPVSPGGLVTYDLYVSNGGPSDAAAVYVVDQLPAFGLVLDPDEITVTIEGGEGQVIEVRHDGRIEILVGRDAAKVGRLDAGSTVHISIQVPVALTAACGMALENVATVETRVGTGFPAGATPTIDPDLANNRDAETTRVECASIEVDKTVSFTGQCPGEQGPVMAPPGQSVTYCLEIRNTGTTWLDYIAITDTIRARTTGPTVVFTDVIRYGADPRLPVAPGETVLRSYTLPPFDECGRVTNQVEVYAIAVNSGRMVLPCVAVTGTGIADFVTIELPCFGVDWRLQLPIIGGQTCETWIQVQNVGDNDTKAAILFWGDAGFCPPQAAGPLKVECSGLLKPGSAWSFAQAQIPSAARSAVAYSLSATMVRNSRGNQIPFADLVCNEAFYGVVGDHAEWLQFDIAYRTRDRYVTKSREVLDFRTYQGEPLAITVNRSCPDPVDPNLKVNAAYSGVSSDQEGARDPMYGGYTYYAPLIFADQQGLSTMLLIQNSGEECSSLEIWFKAQDNCLRAVLGDVLTVAPGETVAFNPNTVVGPGWIGSAWVRGSQPLGIVVDTLGANHFTSYVAVAADVEGIGYSQGEQINYAPLTYSEYQGWDTAIQVQNLSAVYAAKVKVYFLDRSGDVITTLVDWICPRGSQTFFLPLVDNIPGNWVGSVRVESQEWLTSGGPRMEPPRIQSVVLLEKWGDPQRTARREAVAYNALTEKGMYDWQLGSGKGGTASGSAVVAMPLVAKQYRGITTELAITNVVPKPGFTDFAIFIFDQNGLIDYVCQKLNEKQVEYIDLATWGAINPRFMGSAVVSATFWEHDVFDASGGFERNLVGLGAIVVERIGGTLGAPDVPGDESKAYEGFPVFDHFHIDQAPVCPGLPGRR